MADLIVVPQAARPRCRHRIAAVDAPRKWGSVRVHWRSDPQGSPYLRGRRLLNSDGHTLRELGRAEGNAEDKSTSFPAISR